MIKTVYIASSINYAGTCDALSKELKNEFGITITRNWWKDYFKDIAKFDNMNNQLYYSNPEVQIIRELDFKAILDADLIIIINNDNHYPIGALVEVGYAIAHHKIVIFLGEIRRSAMLSSCIHIKTDEELFQLIKQGV